MSETKEIDSVAKLVADVASGIRQALANKTNLALDLPLLFPLVSDVEEVAGGMSQLVPQLKSMDAAGLAQVEADAITILSAVEGAPVSSKLQVEVHAAVVILIQIYDVIKA